MLSAQLVTLSHMPTAISSSTVSIMSSSSLAKGPRLSRQIHTYRETIGVTYIVGARGLMYSAVCRGSKSKGARHAERRREAKQARRDGEAGGFQQDQLSRKNWAPSLRYTLHNSFNKTGPSLFEVLSSQLSATSSGTKRDTLSDIDPITNRRVYKYADTHSEPHIVSGEPVYGYEPDGQKPRVPDPVQEGLADYDAKTQYGVAEEDPGPDQSSPIDPVQEGLADYDAVTQYGVAEENEGPPERFDPSKFVEEGLADYDAVTQYGVAEENPGPSDLPTASSVEEGLSDYDAVTKYGVAEEFPERAVNPNATQNDMFDYDAVTKYGVAEEASSSPNASESPAQDGLFDYDAITKYGVAEEGTQVDPSTSPADTQHNIFDYDKVTKYGVAEEEPLPATSTASDAARDGLFDCDAVTKYGVAEENISENPTAPSSIHRNLFDYDQITKYGVAEEDTSTNRPRKETEDEKMSRRLKLEKDFQNSQYIETIDAAEFRRLIARNRAESTVRSSNEPQKLTGNYGRDFPEESRAVWRAEEDESGVVTLKLAEGAQIHVPSENISQIPHVPSRIPDTPRMQTSLDRVSAPSKPDFTQTQQHKAEEAQIKHNEEQVKRDQHRALVRELRGIYEEQYGSIATAHRTVLEDKDFQEAQKRLVDLKSALSAEPNDVAREITADTPVTPLDSSIPSPSAEAPEPTLYKILAYDPTMQSISTAETTSIVTDSASPLTPAEVLLRLSNPAKFFPHFEPLQAQGYEIVSGSGDVLVFRKVRAAGTGPQPTKSETTTHYPDHRNPIDGMRPIAATGNFASPTGFVNYDHPENNDAEDQEAEPQFISQIDVRRTEPLFSGGQQWSDKGEKRKAPGLGRRVLVGGVAVGGVAYALGVVGEYFKSGGMDGLGPQGF